MASTSSSAAVAAMLQRASQQYLECRRGVTAKVDEVKQLDEQIGAVFAQISALSEAPEGQEELSEQAKAAAKSVGRLEVTLAGVEGEEPVPGTAITVALDPEYEADEYETVEEVVEKKHVVVTDEDGNVVEEGQLPEEDGESTPRKLKTTTKITRTIIKKKVKKEKTPVVRTVAWTAKAEQQEEEQEEGEKPLSFPATFVFDPVQSREAVVIITVAAAAEEEDEDESEPIREIEFPISSLFQDNALDKWYTTADEEEEQEPTTITELVEEAVEEAIEEGEAVVEAVKEAIEEEVAAEKAEEQAEKVEEEAEKVEEEAEKVEEEAEKTEEESEKPEEEAEKTEQETEKAEEEVEKTEAKAEEEDEQTEEVAEKTEEEAEKTEEEAEKTEEVAEEAEQVEEPKPTGPRFHVKASFVLSEAEQLSISVVALSKKKQEAEAALQVLEREAASLRTKFERLNASQRQMSASSVSKPKSNLLGGRFGAGSVPVQRKSWVQSSRERANAFITKNQQLLVSVAMFTGSVFLFHYNGENLLA